MGAYIEMLNRREEIRQKAAALNERGEMMTPEEIEEAIRFNVQKFAGYFVIRHDKGGAVRTFSNYADVYDRHLEDVSQGSELISGARGWKIKKCAREIFEQLFGQKKKPAEGQPASLTHPNQRMK
jgi:hypothetical protein